MKKKQMTEKVSAEMDRVLQLMSKSLIAAELREYALVLESLSVTYIRLREADKTSHD